MQTLVSLKKTYVIFNLWSVFVLPEYGRERVRWHHYLQYWEALWPCEYGVGLHHERLRHCERFVSHTRLIHRRNGYVFTSFRVFSEFLKWEFALDRAKFENIKKTFGESCLKWSCVSLTNSALSCTLTFQCKGPLILKSFASFYLTILMCVQYTILLCNYFIKWPHRVITYSNRWFTSLLRLQNSQTKYMPNTLIVNNLTLARSWRVDFPFGQVDSHHLPEWTS